MLEILDNGIFNDITNKDDDLFKAELTQHNETDTVNFVAIGQDVLLEEHELNDIYPDIEVDGNNLSNECGCATTSRDGEDHDDIYFNVCLIDSLVQGEVNNSPAIVKERSRRCWNPSNWNAAV